MKVLPPPGSLRRRIAIGLLVGLVVLLFLGTVEGLVRWIRHQATFPAVVLACWPAFAVAVWRILAETRESDSADPE